jgi:PTH1 family peptidyl-tRNA hydrolase
MKMIIGLGNPGGEYARTRHNIGWMVAEKFAEKFRASSWKHEKDALTATVRAGGGSVLVAKPLTYMNLSGDAVMKLKNAYAESLDDLIVVYDDIDLPLGKLRIRANGSSGTHNGMRSIVASLASEEFPRLRFGVRGDSYSEGDRLRDYVLEDFEEPEIPAVERAVDRSLDALVMFVRGDLKRAMNTFNRDPEEKPPEPA